MRRAQSRDTSLDADDVQFEILRRMTPVERAALMTELTLAVQDLAMAGMRARHPNASDDELRLRLAVHRLGADTVRKVWGFEVKDEP